MPQTNLLSVMQKQSRRLARVAAGHQGCRESGVKRDKRVNRAGQGLKVKRESRVKRDLLVQRERRVKRDMLAQLDLLVVIQVHCSVRMKG